VTLRRLLRELHLALGLFGSGFLLVYAVSGLQMSHPRLAPRSDTVLEAEVELAPGADARGAEAELRARHRVRGELAAAEPRDGTLRLRFVRPGTVVEAEVESASGRTRLRTTRGDFSRFLNRLHHAAGLGHTDAATNLWGAAVLVLSVSLLALVASGLFLWWQLPRERRAGAVTLAASLGTTALLIALLRFA
jgi:hypothetical protein